MEDTALPAIDPQDSNLSGHDDKKHIFRVGLLMTALCMSVFLAALDINIITTALPTIAQDFQSAAGYTWVSSAFMVGAAASTPNWGKFSDIWGRKNMILVATAIFILGCALCGASVSLTMLIIGRAVQGIGAGGLLLLVNVIIGDLFSQRERSKYYGIVGMTWALASSLGPVIGGALTNNVSWRWCFYINLPISGTVFFVLLFTLKLNQAETSIVDGIKAVDWLGSIAITGATMMLLLGLSFGGNSYAWSSVTVICLIVFGVLTFVLFGVIEQYAALYPILPLHLYASISTLAIFAVDLFHGIVFTQAIFFIPTYFQAVLNASPLLSGVWLLPFVLAASLAAMSAGIILKKTGSYICCLRIGFLLTVLGSGLLYDLPYSQEWAKIVLYQIVTGVGIGLLFQPPLVALQSSVPAEYNGTATASFALIRNIATAIGVVIGSAIFSNKMATAQPFLQAQVGEPVTSLLSGNTAQANLMIVSTLGNTQQRIVHAVLFDAIRAIWIGTVCFAGTGFLVSFLIKTTKLDIKHVAVTTGLKGEEARRKLASIARENGTRVTLSEKTVA